MKRIEDELPGLDCGICGAPSCRALADDIVRGYAEENDCIFWAAKESNEESLPAPFRKKEVLSEKTKATSNDFEENFLKDE